MTQQQQPGWPNPPTGPASKSERPWYRRTWFIVTAALVAMALLFSACLAAVGGALDEAARSVDPADKPITTAAGGTTPPATVDDEQPYDVPKIGDFKLTVKELSRKRFGSAGDLVDYRVQLIQVVKKVYDPDKSYELSYDVIGGEDGKERQTMLITGDEYESYEGSASTRSGVRITAKAVSIEEV